MANPPVVAALLLIRVAVGVTMVMHGYNHWRGGGKIAGTARWFSGLGPRPVKAAEPAAQGART